MESDDVTGNKTMGEVVEVGSERWLWRRSA
jgi:hypothetical protein